MTESDLNKIDMSRHLLPPPGDEAVGELVTELRRLHGAEYIAEVAQNTVAVMARTFGELDFPSWCDLHAHDQQTTINRVQHHIDNPNDTPESTHLFWCDINGVERYSWGPWLTKDIARSIRSIPFDDLPDQTRAKDIVFKQIVNELSKA